MNNYRLSFILWMIPFQFMILYLFLGIFLNYSIFLLCGLFLLILILIILIKFKDEKENHTIFEWDKLYSSNIKTESYFYIINTIFLVFFFLLHFFYPNLYITFKGDITRTYITIFFVFWIMVGIFYIKKISNFYGSEYLDILKRSKYSLRIHLELAKYKLKKQDKTGLKQMRLSLDNINAVLKENNDEFEEINIVKNMLLNMEKYSGEINYKKLLDSTFDLTNFLNGDKLYEGIHKIESDKSLNWAKMIKKKRFIITTTWVPLLSLFFTVLLNIIGWNTPEQKSTFYNIITTFLFNSLTISNLVLYVMIFILLQYISVIFKEEIISNQDMAELREKQSS